MTHVPNRRWDLGKSLAQKLTPLRTQEEVATELGLCPQRGQQIEWEALTKVALRMRAAVKFSKV